MISQGEKHPDCLSRKTNNLIMECLNNSNQETVSKLIDHWESIQFKNSTLLYGLSGIVLSLSRSYQNSLNYELLSYLKRQIKALPDSSDLNGLCYGLSGNCLSLMYYYQISGDRNAIEKIKKNIESILSSLLLTPGTYYHDLGLNFGTTGVLLILFSLREAFRDKIFISNVLEAIISYEDSFLMKKSNDSIINKNVLTEMLCVRRRMLSMDIDNEIHLNERIKTSAGMIEECLALKKDTFEPLGEQQLNILKIVELCDFRRGRNTISLNFNAIVFSQLNRKFSRSLKIIDIDIDFSRFYHINGLETIEAFATYVDSDFSDNVFKKMFLFEYQKHQIEFMIRHNKIDDLYKKEMNEIGLSFETIKLEDELFLNTPFVIPETVFFIQADYYETYEIERDIIPSSSYIIALKPKITNGDLYLTEICLQGTYRVLLIIRKHNMPITPSKLIKIFKANVKDEEKYKVELKIFRFIKKMVSRGYLVPLNA